MARCKMCDKHGLFLKLDNDGLCEDCAKKVQQQRREKRLEIERQKKEEATANLYSIPEYDISLSKEKRKRQSRYEPPKFSNITPKGVYDSYVVFDTETTGITPSKDRIIELAAIKVENNQAVSRFRTLINPEKPIPPEATLVNNITDEMVADAPTISEVLPAFEDFIGNYTLIGHNLDFDLRFLYYSGSTLLDTKRKYIDTLEQSHKIIKKSRDGLDHYFRGELASYTLENLCKYYGITTVDDHTALSDAFATAYVFSGLVQTKQEI